VITVNVVLERGARLVTVEDEGPGIPAAMRDEVFHPFVRGEASGGDPCPQLCGPCDPYRL